MAYLSPSETALFNQRRSKLRTDYGTGKAQNQFERGQLDLDYDLTKRNLGSEWGRARTHLPGAYARGGTLNSGVYQRALQDYAAQRGLAFEGAAREYQRGLGQLGVRSTAQSNAYTSGLNLIAAEEQARRAQLAASLQGAKW